MATRPFFEELKKVIKDQTVAPDAVVSNLQGVVAETPVQDSTVTGEQAWYVMQAPFATMPSLREFADAHSRERLPVSQIAATAGKAIFPAGASLPPGYATLFFTSFSTASATRLALSLRAPGHGVAIYTDSKLVTSGSNGLDTTLDLTAGEHFIAILAYNGTAPVEVTVDPAATLILSEPTPSAPVLSGSGTSGYLKAQNGSYIAAIEWLNDAFASGWQVYRADAVNTGVIISSSYSNGFTTVRVPTDVSDVVVEGMQFYTQGFFGGAIVSVTPTTDGSGNPVTDLVVLNDPAAPTTSWAGYQFWRSSNSFRAVSRLTYTGEPTLRFEDTSVMEGQVYLYKVTAFGFINGTSESDYSATAFVSVGDEAAPGPVTLGAVDVIAGTAYLQYTAPADLDFRGVRLYRKDGAVYTQVAEQQAVANAQSVLAFVPSASGTYWLRTFDWAGNEQPEGAGVSWTWDGLPNYSSPLTPTIFASVNKANATADLIVQVSGLAARFPATIEIYEDQMIVPIQINGLATSVVLAGPGTIDKSLYPALGGLALPLTVGKHWWVRVKDVDNHYTWGITQTVTRGGLPGGQVTVDDFKAQPVFNLTYDDNVEKVVVKKGGVVKTTLTRGSGLAASGRGTSTYTVPVGDALAVGATAAWSVEYTTSATTLVLWTGLLHGDKPLPPRFDYISAIIDAAASDQPRYDITLKVIDPSGLGGTLSVWVNPFSTASANPAGAADATLGIAAGNMPFTAGVGTTFGAAGTILNDVKGNYTTPKSVFFEFVNTAGGSTGKVEVQIFGNLGTILNADGTLKPIGKTNFASTIKPVEIYASVPTNAQGADGDVAYATSNGRLYRKVAGAWVSYTSASGLEGQITSTQITDGAISTPKLAANAITANELAADSAIFGKIAAAAANFTTTVTTYLTAGGIDAGKISVNQLSDFKKGDGTSAGLGIFVGGTLKSVVNDSNGDPVAYLDLNATGSSPVLYSTAFTISADGNASYSGNVDADSIGALSVSIGTDTLPGTLSLKGTAQLRALSVQASGAWGGTAQRIDLLNDNLFLYSAGNVLHALLGTYTLNTAVPATATDSSWSAASATASRGGDGTTTGATIVNNLTAASLPSNSNEYTINLTLELDTQELVAIGFTNGSSYNVDGTVRVYYRTSAGGALVPLFSQTLNDSVSVPSGESNSGYVQTISVSRTVTIPGIASGGYLDIVVEPSITYTHTGRCTGTAYLTATGGAVTWPQVAAGAVTRRGARFYSTNSPSFGPAFSIEPLAALPANNLGRAGDVIFVNGSLYTHDGTQWQSGGGASSFTQAQADALYPKKDGSGATGTWAIGISGNAATASSVQWTGVSGKPTTATGFAADAVDLSRLGASSTSGVLDWNDTSHSRPGTGPTLLLGNATNGPNGAGNYFHTFNLEYSTKTGLGNVTQLAIPYSNSIAPGIWIRGRYTNAWTAWSRLAYTGEAITDAQLSSNIPKLNAANVFTTINTFSVPTSSTFVLAGKIPSDTISRFALRANGSMEWGPGVGAARDVTLARSDVGVLALTGSLDIGTTTGITAAPLRVGGDIRSSGVIYATDFVLVGSTGAGTGGTSGVLVQDHGGTSTLATTLNFMGAGVTASVVGDVATITVNATGSGAVSSVFGRTGAVTAQVGDYSWAQIAGKPNTLTGLALTDFVRTVRTSADVNTLLVSGHYGLSNTNANLPAAYTAMLVVNNSDVGLQLAGGYSTDNLYFRGYYSSGASFTSWRTILHSGNYTTYGDARWVLRGGSGQSVLNLVLSGNVNPYLQFSDGSKTAYLEMVSGDMRMYHNGREFIRWSGSAQTTTLTGTLQNGGTAGASGWWQLGAGASPASAQLVFGTDNSGWSFEIAKKVGAAAPVSVARFYDGGSGTNAFTLYGGMEAIGGSVVIGNGQGYYARRSTNNAVIACFRYDSGTDDLTTVIGGNIWRVRDTGAGVPMSLAPTGEMKLAGTANAIWVTDRSNSAQAFAFYSTGGNGILWTSQGIDALKIAYSTGAATFVNNITVGGRTHASDGVYFINNYGIGNVGLYDPSRYRAIYAMGDAYKMAADGTTLGSLYGLFYAYDHPSYKNITGYTLGHGFGMAENGVVKFFVGSQGLYAPCGVIAGGSGAWSAQGWQKSVMIGNGGNVVYGYGASAGVDRYGLGMSGGYLYLMALSDDTASTGGFYVWQISRTSALINVNITAPDFILSSDRRLKMDLRVIDSALDKVSKVSGYTGRFKAKPDQLRAMVVAQEIQEIAPECVYEDEEGMLSVSYTSLVPYLIEAIKELRHELNEVRHAL